MLRLFVRITGAIAILAGSFLGTLFVIDHPSDRAPQIKQTSGDLARSTAADTLMTGLAKYRASKGGYPVLAGSADGEISALSTYLVDSGFLPAIPTYPSEPGKTMRYISYDGKQYGILIFFDRGRCRILVDIASVGWWGDTTPACQLYH